MVSGFIRPLHLQDRQQDQGNLTELPSISRWQILRLEEEGINSLGALAYHPRQNIKTYLPNMAKLADYWADIARLYAIAGDENYKKIRPYCMSASEFVLKAKDDAFKTALADSGINNCDEIANQLVKTFPDILPVNTAA